MKKICLIFNHFQHQDGVSRSALAIANNLVKMELAEVTLISIFTDEKEFHKELDPRVKMKHVFGFYFRGMPHIVKHIPKSWIIRKSLNDEYDVMIGFQEGLPIKYIAASHRSSNVNKFAWLHCYFDWLIPTLKDDYKKIGTVVCVSRCNAERLHKEIPIITTDYSYNPIDEKYVIKCGEEVCDIKRPTNMPLFVSVGRMSWEKGYDRLIRISRRLLDEGYKFNLWLVGDGPIYKELQSLNQELRMENCIKFLGRQNNPHKYTSKADLFICSSFIEGYSTACTEAIMLGVPVITTNVSGAEEIIEDAECGRLLGMDDESLYNGLKEILDSPTLVNEWKKKLLTTRQRFYAETRIKKLAKILRLDE